MTIDQTDHIADNRRRQGLMAAGGLLAALAASSCCILPLVLFGLGVSGAWIGNFTRLAAYQPYFLTATLACLGYGYWLVFRSSKLACALCLNWRTRHRAVGTENATIAGPGFQLCAAASAFIEELTGIGRHGLRFRNAAVRTGDGRLKKHWISSWVRMDNLPWWSPKSAGSHRLWRRHRRSLLSYP